MDYNVIIAGVAPGPSQALLLFAGGLALLLIVAVLAWAVSVPAIEAEPEVEDLRFGIIHHEPGRVKRARAGLSEKCYPPREIDRLITAIQHGRA